MKIDTILFDLDGVLINSWPFILASFGHTLSRFDLPKDGLAHPKMRHCTLKQAYEHLGVSSRFDEATKIHIEFQNNNLDLVQGFPEAVPVLEILASRFRIGVVSNRYKNSAQLLRHCKLFEYVELIVGAEDVFRSKPHPEGIFSAMEFFRTDPERTVMVGDTPSDIQAGKAAGVWTMAVDTSDCLEILRQNEPNYILQDLREMVPLLTKS